MATTPRGCFCFVVVASLALLTALPGLALDRQTAIGILEQACMQCALWEQGPLPSLEAAQVLESQLLMILDEYGEELVVTTDLSHLPPEAANHDMNSQAGAADYNALVIHADQVVPISAKGLLWEVRLSRALVQPDILILSDWVLGCDASAARARLMEAEDLASGWFSSVGSAQDSVWYWRARAKLLELAKAPAPLVYAGSRPMMALAERDAQLYLPLRVANLMSPSTPKCSWDATQQTALCEGTRRLAVHAGSVVAEVDGAPMKLSAPPRIEDGRLMISVRDVKPLFGLDYKWDPKLWAVRIFSPET